MVVVIGTGSIGSCKSKYHTITTTTASRFSCQNLLMYENIFNTFLFLFSQTQTISNNSKPGFILVFFPYQLIFPTIHLNDDTLSKCAYVHVNVKYFWINDYFLWAIIYVRNIQHNFVSLPNILLCIMTYSQTCLSDHLYQAITYYETLIYFLSKCI